MYFLSHFYLLPRVLSVGYWLLDNNTPFLYVRTLSSSIFSIYYRKRLLWCSFCPTLKGSTGKGICPLAMGQITKFHFSLVIQPSCLLCPLEWVLANFLRKPFPGNYSMVNGGKMWETMVHADQYMDPTFPRKIDLWLRENIYHRWQFKVFLFLENKWKINFYMHPLTRLHLLSHEFLKRLVRPINFPFFKIGSILVSSALEKKRMLQGKGQITAERTHAGEGQRPYHHPPPTTHKVCLQGLAERAAWPCILQPGPKSCTS